MSSVFPGWGCYLAFLGLIVSPQALTGPRSKPMDTALPTKVDPAPDHSWLTSYQKSSEVGLVVDNQTTL